MKKKLTALFLAMVMCMTMSAPAFAFGNESNNSIVMPCADMDGCLKGHTAPAGFTYHDYYTGNSLFDAQIQNSVLEIVGIVPVVGEPLSKVISTALDLETIANLIEDGQLRTTYHQYCYINSIGTIWYHTIWYYRGTDGHLHQLTCDVTEVYVSNR